MFEIGQQITYILLPKDLPTDANREWHGIIIALHGAYLKVQLTDKEYEGNEEWIEAKQVRSVESKTGSKNAKHIACSQSQLLRDLGNSTNFMYISLNHTILKKSPVSPSYFSSVCYTGISSFSPIMAQCN